jgi:hypothetical protein
MPRSGSRRRVLPSTRSAQSKLRDETLVLREKRVEVAVRQHDDAWQLPRLLTLLDQFHSVGREATTCRDNHHLDHRWFPERHPRENGRHFVRVDGLCCPVLALDDDPDPTGRHQRIGNELVRLNVAAPIWCTRWHEPGDIGVAVGSLKQHEDQTFEQFVVERIPPQRRWSSRRARWLRTSQGAEVNERGQPSRPSTGTAKVRSTKPGPSGSPPSPMTPSPTHQPGSSSISADSTTTTCCRAPTPPSSLPESSPPPPTRPVCGVLPGFVPFRPTELASSTSRLPPAPAENRTS